jgi:Ni/Co efflux regulator RcnB
VNRFARVAVFSTLSVALLAGPAFAQGQDDHRDNRDQSSHNDADHRDNRDQGYHDDADRHDSYVRHQEWKKGYHMRQEDWSRAQRVEDWRTHRLRRPPRGYEWRSVDGNYVLADINTGIVNTVVAVPVR